MTSLSRPLLLVFALSLVAGCGTLPADRAQALRQSAITAVTPALHSLPPLFDDLEHRTFSFFWERANPVNGLIPDRWPSRSFSSIAAVGFGLTAYGVGAERGWITRAQATQRTLVTLRFFANAAQGDAAQGMTGTHGFFYHFIKMDTGTRDANCELSTVDTSLLLGGILFAQSYYDRDNADEAEIRALADSIYRRVDWAWAQARPPKIAMGWTPEGGMQGYDWSGYNEALLVYVLALGSPTHPLGKDAYDAWTSTYPRTWGTFQGQQHLGFAPLFGHQYSHTWLDLRGVQDGYMRGRGLDYFENSRRAVLSQRAYAIANPSGWNGYGANVWGLTASDGPIDAQFTFNGRLHKFQTYAPRGAGLDYILDDGTLAPTAAAASLPFAPQLVIPAVTEMHRRYGKDIYRQYGFIDAFNPSFNYSVTLKQGKLAPGLGWVDDDYLGIDQGPIVLMIENYRSELVWTVMRRNRYIRRGMERAGFRGGWIAAEAVGSANTDAANTDAAAHAAPEVAH